MLVSKWLDKRQLKELKRQIQYIGSTELNSELDDYLQFNDDGYLMNIFSNQSLIELKELENYLCLIF